MESSSPSTPRKPLPQPTETTQRRSRKAEAAPQSHAGETGDSKPSQRPLPQNVETTSGSARRPADDGSEKSSSPSISSRPLPQPVETSDFTSKPRRFAPQMVGSSRRSRRNTDTSIGMGEDERTDGGQDEDDWGSRRRNRRQSGEKGELTPRPPINTPACSSVNVPQLPPESKFSSSKLAEKQQRRHSFRVPDLPSIRSSSGTEEESLPSLTRTPSADSDPTRRSNSHKRKKTYPISSRESEDEQVASYLLTLAASAAEKQLRDQAMAAYPNEQVHEPVDHYAIDRDSSDSDTDIHVGKLGGAKAGDDHQRTARGTRGQRHERHRDSGAGFEMAEMRSHQAKLASQRQEARAAGVTEPPRDRQPEVRKSNVLASSINAPSRPHVYQNENTKEAKAMRRAAAPPMAGRDLRFPKCLSPKQTRVDPHQHPTPRNRTPSNSRQPTGLWCTAKSPSQKSSLSSGTAGIGSGGGLWMGVNAISAQPGMAVPSLRPGLVTPARERSDPYSLTTTPSLSRHVSRSPSPAQSLRASLAMTSVITSPISETAPPSRPFSPPLQLPTPPPSGPDTTEKRRRKKWRPSDEALKREFPDEFVTQVYNYLSLGYPVVARPYDEEIARITRVDTSTLEKDDEAAAPLPSSASSPPAKKEVTSAPDTRKNEGVGRDHGDSKSKPPYARGYVGVPEGTGADARGASTEPGERWKALRLYIWEWGRQQRGIWEVAPPSSDPRYGQIGEGEIDGGGTELRTAEEVESGKGQDRGMRHGENDRGVKGWGHDDSSAKGEGGGGGGLWGGGKRGGVDEAERGLYVRVATAGRKTSWNW